MTTGAAPPSSTELVARVLAGDRLALTALTTDLLLRVRNLVRYLIRGDQDLDDIAQEALLTVLRGLGTYRGQGTVESWSDRVVARATFAWLKRRRLGRERPLADWQAERVASPEVLPDEYLSRRQFVLLLDQLPLDQRHALVLHHVVGLSVDEIAAETGALRETVRTRLRLGRLRMRELGLRAGTEEALHDET
jgi:RNA polymerase sigma-70 factor (ECF subfamily)